MRKLSIFILLVISIALMGTAPKVRKPSSFGEVYSSNYRSHPRYKSVTAHWLMLSGGGTTLRDISGYNNHGTFSGMDAATDWIKGPFGGPVLTFDGSNDDVIFTRHSTLEPANKISLSVWTRPVEGQTDQSGPVAKRWADWDDPYNSFSLDMTTNPYWRFCVSSGSASSLVCATSSVSPVQEWTHLAATYDGAKAYLYVNGVEVASASPTVTLGYSSYQMRLGQVNAIAFYAGEIDDVRLYHDRAITPAEVMSLYRDPFLEFRSNTILAKVAAAAEAACAFRALIGVGC